MDLNEGFIEMLMVIFSRARKTGVILKDRNHSSHKENKPADPENARLLTVPEKITEELILILSAEN